ncbi:MAG: restriction endonuclease subunit S [Lutibacter sp.]|nr:restriction endonuclease subunit S [Lutibacter sp.]
MEGLEISEIWNSELERTSRIDSEFYSKENLKIIETLSKHKLEDITQLVNVADGNHLSISDNFLEKGIPYYRGQNLHNIFIEDSQPICIDEETFNLPAIKRSHLKQGDVLLSIVGTIGGVSLVTTNEKATCNCKLAILRPRKIDSYFLFLFLRSKYGQNQIKKFTRGAVQMGLILEDMNQIMIPVFSNTFQLKISERVQAAKSLLNNAKKNLHNAEKVLLDALNIKDDISNSESINIKNFSESFLSTGRLDAEYYQKKYEDVIERIKQYKFGYNRLESFIKDYSTGYPYKSENYTSVGIPVIRINNITNGVLNLENAVKIDHSDINLSEKDIAVENDLLISMSGSIGNSCKIPNGIKAVVNQRIMRITPKNFNVDVLALIINSHIGKTQLDRIGTGGVQTNISATDIKQILIPNLPNDEQVHISNLIKKSFILKNESEQLLNAAKLAVELAIEEGEEKGLEMIRKLESI